MRPYWADIVECTKDQSWDKVSKPGQRVLHRNADEVGDQRDGYPGGDIVTYECPHCGTRWEAELPQ